MRDAIRKWLGFDVELKARDEMIRSLYDTLQEKHAVAAELERINAGLCGNLNMIGEHLANLRLELGELTDVARKYVVVSDPAIDDPIVCPNDHKGCMIVATLVEVDAKTLIQRPCGYGIYCPKCQSSFYYQNGHRWAAAGTTVEVENGVPADTPKGTHREPEVKTRKLRFRG